MYKIKLVPKRFHLSQINLLRRNYHYDSEKYKHYGHKAVRQKYGFQLSEAAELNRANNSNLFRAITNYRIHGHRVSDINPLASGTNSKKEDVSELELSRYRLNFDETIEPTGLVYGGNLAEQIKVKEAIDFVKTVYTGHTGYEFMHIENEAEREWFAREIETRATEEIPVAKKLKYALEMAKSQNFDQFVAVKFPTLKRYGGEGCESVMAFYLELFHSCVINKVHTLVVGMAHRGRLNFLAGPLRLPPVKIFHKMKGYPEFSETTRGSGDVLSHLGTSVNLTMIGGSVHVSLLNNPSHLEAINPVAVGKVRAKQLEFRDYDYALEETKVPPHILCLQVHGDAALAAQGINQETLGFSNVPNFRIGGSIHLVINNQIGFTTPPEMARSSRYATDIGKMVHTPVIHVNAAYPEEVAKAAQLALAYRQEFEKDIFVDLICFRRWGHNEMDDPTFTHPKMYKKIHSRKSLPDEYCDRLKDENILSSEVLQNTITDHTKFLNEHLKQADDYVAERYHLLQQWHTVVEPGTVNTTWDTGSPIDLLKYVGAKSVEYPKDFEIHPQLKKVFVDARLSKITSGKGIDWATAEALAVGSLLHQGFNVRLSGEDVGRGTFSHRHMMLTDQGTGEAYIPLNYMHEGQDKFLEIANSTLSEEAVLGFEYGFSTEHPDNLVIWEAQFGDFFNGAQILIDTMISSGEIKWLVRSGLVLLLPHGMDGAGPEHSSCRIERFLQLTDSHDANMLDGDYNNMQVVNPTTPAQYFHLLRRQVLRDFRKPLVVASPKILLRLSAATSSIADMGPNTSFKPVIGDTSESVSPSNVKRMIFVSGKHYYALQSMRDELKAGDVAIVRIESLCPFPVEQIEQEIAKYPNATKFIWSQEEHRNQGAWLFVQPRFENLLGKSLHYAGRGILAAPSVGISKWHQREVTEILRNTFAID